MGTINRRDLVAGIVIVFLLGVLAGQWLGDWRERMLSRGVADAAEPQPVAAPAADPKQLGKSFADIAERVTPAVVNINSTRTVRGRTYYDPFREFFYGDGRYKEPDRTSQSLGSGVIIDPNGIVVTNNHNIQGADEVRVALADSREFVAQIVGRDPSSDVAVLRIDGRGLPAAQWADSDALRVGEWVIAIGNPYGFSESVTAGIVSAKGRRDVGISEFEEFIQTDAAINPGNSGGALIDTDGRLVGINTAIFSETGGYQGIGFAIPSNVARRYVEQILQHGKVIRGWIGVVVESLNSRVARQLGLRDTNGALVTVLWRDQPAVRAGVQPGDVVVGVNDRRVDSPRDLRQLIAEAPIGSTVTLKIIRAGRPVTCEVKIEDHPYRADGDPVPGL